MQIICVYRWDTKVSFAAYVWTFLGMFKHFLGMFEHTLCLNIQKCLNIPKNVQTYPKKTHFGKMAYLQTRFAKNMCLLPSLKFWYVVYCDKIYWKMQKNSMALMTCFEKNWCQVTSVSSFEHFRVCLNIP